MTDLSPQAQAVQEAAFSSYWSAEQAGKVTLTSALFTEVIAAAALEAAADQVVPEEAHPQVYQDCCDYAGLRARMSVRNRLLTIAAELRGQEDSND